MVHETNLFRQVLLSSKLLQENALTWKRQEPKSNMKQATP